MTDYYSDSDVVDILREQLPRDLRKLHIKVTNEPRIAIFTYKCKSASFPIQEDGHISEIDLLNLCVRF
jgi:hypothetical protein